MAKPKKQRTASRQTTSKKSTVKSNPELDQWMTCDLSVLTVTQLSEGAIFLNKTIDANAKLGLDELVVQQRTRVVELIQAWLKTTNNFPGWFFAFHQKQLRESALACDRIAVAAVRKDDAKAAEYWQKGAALLVQLIVNFPGGPDWARGAHVKQLREGALACDRIAVAAVRKDDAKAAEYWQKGAALLGQLIANYLGNPKWVRELHLKQLREGALACDRIAVAAVKKDDARAADYWAQGASRIGELLNAYPAPDWAPAFHQKQLREGALACDRIAVAAVKKDDARAADYWAQGASRIGELLNAYPAPDWAPAFHQKQLREGALACDRIAVAAVKKDDARAADYWAQGASRIGELLNAYPAPDWAPAFHQKQLREGALACDRIAVAAVKKDDARAADYWAQGASRIGELLNAYPAPDWAPAFHQKQLREGALACDRIADLAKRA